MQSDFDKYRKLAPADISDAELSEAVIIGHFLKSAREDQGLILNSLGLPQKGHDVRHFSFVNKIKPVKGPILWMVSDIIAKDTSGGPESFHRKSLLKWRSTIRAALINEGDRSVEYYKMAVFNALLGGHPVAVIETTQRHGADWSDFFEQGQIGVLIVTPRSEFPVQ